MSAWMTTTTHIRALVSAATLRDKHDQLPAPDWAKLAERFPEAFRLTVDPDGKACSAAIGRGWIRAGFDDELGRALWLANADSIVARYPGDGDGGTRHPDMWPGEPSAFANVLRYRHALVELPVVTLIKAVHCFSYQACEVSDFEATWAHRFCEALESILVRDLPGYDGAPWGIDDPDEGAPEPGQAGAPVSLMSMMRRV